MHSSRMRTVRNSSRLLGGVPGPGGVPVGGGVYLPGGCTWSRGCTCRGCTWSRGCTCQGVYLVPGGMGVPAGVYLVPGGVPAFGGVPGLGECTCQGVYLPGGVPGPRGGWVYLLGCTWCQEVYLPGGVYLVWGSVPVRGCTCRGVVTGLGVVVYLAQGRGGVPGPGGYLPRYSPCERND